ncbi:transcriptional regulator [Sphingomonas sp. BIUV-7]|uniref:Transcriptional regulator n=1 Tax=Sphingomonas natans TaxID=3063330 RepID=A0ABT8Y734_9SPHN|nr:transcriptional regulator [Sphingomonas sp. BIUV-7]MDO6414128.1 transcriptional regulator [Sphingomonas sp. BIUV-7]
MRAFLDFEASSLGKRSYPIEVAWVFEDGTAEGHLILPAPNWTDWDEKAEAVHGIARATLLSEGEPVETVAARMMQALSGHKLFASAPSWDGKWLSALLRAGGQPRHGLRLRDSEEAQREVAEQILAEAAPSHDLGRLIERIVAQCAEQQDLLPTAHRAMADAQAELAHWLAVADVARVEAKRLGS